MHYERARKSGGDPGPAQPLRPRRGEGTCAVDGCERPYFSLGWCQGHYQRVKTHGEPGTAYLRREGPEGRADRFWSKVAKGAPDECWEWQGTRDGDGYGVFTEHDEARVNKRVYRKAHQVAFEFEHGWYPAAGSGLELRHLCGNRPCVNVAHLTPGTSQENTDDRLMHGAKQLSYAQACEIRERLAKGEVGRRLAEEFGVCPATITHIKQGVTHKPRT